MAKKAKKAVKKAVKKIVEVLKSPPAPKPEVPKPEVPKESKIRKHIENLSGERNDASIILREINDKDLTDEDIREVIRQHNFGNLLDKVS